MEGHCRYGIGTESPIRRRPILLDWSDLILAGSFDPQNFCIIIIMLVSGSRGFLHPQVPKRTYAEKWHRYYTGWMYTLSPNQESQRLALNETTSDLALSSSSSSTGHPMLVPLHRL